ncbi:MAG: guanylate kinase [Alphaproteobacteria bacterium]|nr:guanylate kinase [Alphaproteobacteria bacterium]
MGHSTLKRRGLMFVLSSPSGAGKTTVTRALLRNNADLEVSVSATTRPRRPGEVQGQDYYFATPQEFDEMVEAGDMLEHAKVFGHYYGTPRRPVESALKDGKDVVFDIDWQGTQQLAEIAREDLVTVFILPPSRQELERRLRARGRDTDEDIRHRMDKASDEMTHYIEYDYVLVNKDVEATIENAQKILDAERMKRHRAIGMSDFVKGLKQGI